MPVQRRVLYAVTVVLAMTVEANAQCVLNVNMPPPEFTAPPVYPIAWPRVGWRGQTPTSPDGMPWITMSSVTYVFCGTGTQCDAPGDVAFTSAQKDSMRTSLALE